MARRELVTQKMTQSELFRELRFELLKLDPDRPVWLSKEERRWAWWSAIILVGELRDRGIQGKLF